MTARDVMAEARAWPVVWRFRLRRRLHWRREAEAREALLRKDVEALEFRLAGLVSLTALLCDSQPPPAAAVLMLLTSPGGGRPHEQAMAEGWRRAYEAGGVPLPGGHPDSDHTSGYPAAAAVQARRRGMHLVQEGQR